MYTLTHTHDLGLEKRLQQILYLDVGGHHPGLEVNTTSPRNIHFDSLHGRKIRCFVSLKKEMYEEYSGYLDTPMVIILDGNLEIGV